MKKLLTIFLLLMLMCVCLFGISSVAYAEELPETTTETVSEETTESEDLETIKEKLNALIAKHNAEIDTAKNFFISRVLPALIAGGISTLIGLLFGLKGRKGKKEFIAKYNQVATAYNEQEKRIKDLTDQRNQQYKDIELLQSENAELKLKLTAYDNLSAKLNIIENKQDRIIAGANQAWAECPEAIRAVNKEIENMAAMYQMEVDKLMSLIGEEEKKAMAEDVAVQKALELVVNAAVEK